MKVPLSWLKEYVDITLPPAEIAERLTMAGSEVKGMQVIGGNWENIVIGQITAVDPHPNADRLRLTTVDLGTEKETVVCGAPNLNVGDKIAFARVGAQLIDPYKGNVARLTPAKIRGVVSRGMVCSEKELGISDSHEGIMVLPPELPVGAPLADYLGDTVLDIDVTPNRPDCLSVIGIAREVAALTGQSTHIPEIAYAETELPIDEKISVEIIDADLCGRYCASLITGVNIAESPRWMQERLIAGGMRPINNIVDITNYVMLEYGQPLHAFDYEKIRGKQIVVRRAQNGEGIESLDGVERTLSPNMLVIADAERAVAIAGVMGGANSEVTENTSSILLEAASFNPASIHYTAARLQLASEASMRFERGIRPGLTVPALKHATCLIAELGGGKVARGIADVYPGETEPEPIRLSTSEVKRISGAEFSLKQITETLTSLGFAVKPSGNATEVLVTAPYWRNDISQEVDLIEEVARIAGYDRIPMTMLSEPIPPYSPDPLTSLGQKVRNCLMGHGFQELVTYSLVGWDTLIKLLPETGRPEPVPLHIANPMTAEQEYLRPNLRANLLTALASNRRHEDGTLRLFELGKVYLPREQELPEEPEFLGAVISGARAEPSWLGEAEPLGFFDTKGIVENLLSHLKIEADFEPAHDQSLHPSRQAAIIIGGNRLGILGEVHPRVIEAFDLDDKAYLFELNVKSLLPFISEHRMYQPVPRFPGIVRDIALTVDLETSHRQIEKIIRGFPLVSGVTVFDVYTGKQVPPGKKSLAYRIVFRSPEHTLVDDEVNKVQEKILKQLSRQLGATLRA